MKAQTKRVARYQLDGATEISDYLVEQAQEMEQVYRNGDLTEEDFLDFIVNVRLNAGRISNLVSDEMARMGLNEFEEGSK